MAKKTIPGVVTPKAPEPVVETPTIEVPKPKPIKIKREVSNNTIPNIMLFFLTKKRKNPSITGAYYPLTSSVPYEDIIYDAEKNQNRKIRYAPGETSIYVDDQHEEAKVSTIVFQRGQLIVRKEEPLLREYLLNSNFFQGNPNRNATKPVLFKLQDLAKDSRKELKKAEDIHYAEGLALKMKGEKAVTLARVLGLGADRSMYEIRHDLKIMASKDPMNFIAVSESPKLERMNILMEAQDYGIIRISARTVNWTLGGRNDLIVNVPVGMKALDFFTDFTYEKDGEEVYETIKKKHKMAVEG